MRLYAIELNIEVSAVLCSELIILSNVKSTGLTGNFSLTLSIISNYFNRGYFSL